MEDVSISSNYTGDIIDVDNVHSGYSIVLELEDGIAPNITFKLEVSSDKQNFSELTGTSQNFTDLDGSITWDVIQTNTSFVRIIAVHSSGSITAKVAILTAKRLH